MGEKISGKVKSDQKVLNAIQGVEKWRSWSSRADFLRQERGLVHGGGTEQPSSIAKGMSSFHLLLSTYLYIYILLKVPLEMHFHQQQCRFLPIQLRFVTPPLGQGHFNLFLCFCPRICSFLLCNQLVGIS